MCHEHGLNFIGPTTEQIQTMGDKATARDTMKVCNFFLTFRFVVFEGSRSAHRSRKRRTYQNGRRSHKDCKRSRLSIDDQSDSWCILFSLCLVSEMI